MPDAPEQKPPLDEEPDVERPASASATEDQIEHELPTVHALDYSPAPADHDPYAAWRSRDYRIFSFGWFIAVIGAQIQSTALQWEMYDRTRSTLYAGWVAGLQVLPVFLLTIPAGNLADRLDRRRIIAFSHILAAVCSAGLAMLSYRENSVLPMLLLLTLNSACLVMGRPARASIMPMLLPRRAFANAVTWNASLFQISAMAGPALGGMIVAYSLRGSFSVARPQSVANAYALDAACTLIFALLIGFVRLRKSEEPPAHADRSVLAGFRFIWQNKILLGTIGLDMFAVLLGGAAYLLSIFAYEIIPPTTAYFPWLERRELMFAWLKSAEAVGAFAMTMLIAHMPPMKKAGRAMLLAVLGFGVCTIVFGLSRHFWLSFAALVLLGACDSISVVVRHTLVQILTPDDMRGRVSAVNGLSIGASNELGGLESGLMASFITYLCVVFVLTPDAQAAKVAGVTGAVLFGGIGAIVTVGIVAWRFSEIRRFGKLQDARL